MPGTTSFNPHNSMYDIKSISITILEQVGMRLMVTGSKGSIMILSVKKENKAWKPGRKGWGYLTFLSRVARECH